MIIAEFLFCFKVFSFPYSFPCPLTYSFLGPLWGKQITGMSQSRGRGEFVIPDSCLETRFYGAPRDFKFSRGLWKPIWYISFTSPMRKLSRSWGKVAPHGDLNDGTLGLASQAFLLPGLGTGIPTLCICY